MQIALDSKYEGLQLHLRLGRYLDEPQTDAINTAVICALRKQLTPLQRG